MKRKTSPLVSIIIPAYNAASYVRGALDSALSQTYKNIEIIVVDDGSTDNTKKVLEPYVKAKKIIYINQTNQGLAAARNAGIKISQGSYIALLDADDLFLAQKIEKQTAFLENNPRCDISYSDLYHFFDDEPETLLKLNYRYYSGSDVLPNLIKRHFIAPLTLMMRRTVFDRFGLFNRGFRRSEDLEFLVRVASRGGQICFLGEILAKLRLRRADNLQGFESQPEVKRTGLKIFEDLYRKLNERERKKLELRKYLILYRLKTGLAYLEMRDKKNAQPFIQGAFRDFSGGKLLGFFLWFPFALIPSSFLATLIRRYHIKKQHLQLRRI